MIHLCFVLFTFVGDAKLRNLHSRVIHTWKRVL